MPNDQVMVKLQLERMKETILHQFMLSSCSLSDQINAEIEKQIAAFDYQAEVEKVAKEVIAEGIRRYFSYAGPGREAINKAVAAALGELFGIVKAEE